MYSSKVSVSKRFSVSVRWDFLCIFSFFLNNNIVEEPGRMYLPVTLAFLAFICKLLIFMGDTLVNKESPRKFLFCKFLGFSTQILTFVQYYIYIYFFFATFKFYYHSEKSELFMRLEACKFSGKRLTPISHKASQRLAFKTSSCI